jgi:hypothetical protein
LDDSLQLQAPVLPLFAEIVVINRATLPSRVVWAFSTFVSASGRLGIKCPILAYLSAQYTISVAVVGDFSDACGKIVRLGSFDSAGTALEARMCNGNSVAAIFPVE